ncbi:hypothetical protein N8I77_012168 [Diaporthe amygdali]|uniref:Cytochrome P450 n=1 Tax=Phomopsis amygdali TaxID=1214568 RepID=A0AAD9S4C7_PHOAM|nr:hypothetical protein N8I77_012168 [Diaporthe amygdali]
MVVLKDKLIPELWKYVDMARDEWAYSWLLEPSDTTKWVGVNLEYTVRMLVARLTATVFMGHPVCRDPEWLKISLELSVDMFKTTVRLKMFPPWLYPIAIRLLPAARRSKSQLRQAQKIVAALMQKHAAAVASGTEEEDVFLHWQIDHALPSEKEVPEMAKRQCILTLASIHTTAMTVGHMIYDLCAHSEWITPMVKEVDGIFKSLARPGDKWGEATALGISSKAWLAREPITFKDGTKIPEGTRVAFPMYDCHMDSGMFPNLEVFDPMRIYRKRHASPDQKHLLMAGQTSPNNLSFGYGNQACSGRQFAVAEIKLIVGRLLHEYEFRLPEGKSRPKVMYINENVFPDQSATVLLRRRNAS